MIVVSVDLQVLGELVDTSGEDGDLNLGRTGVGLMGAVGLDDGSLFVLTDHRIFPPFKNFPCRSVAGGWRRRTPALLSPEPGDGWRFTRSKDDSTNSGDCKGKNADKSKKIR